MTNVWGSQSLLHGGALKEVFQKNAKQKVIPLS